jgi:hypothetical protein
MTCGYKRIFFILFQFFYVLIIIFNIATLFAQGSGNCLDFDGSNDYVAIPENSPDIPIYLDGTFTVEFWVMGIGVGVGDAVYSEANESSSTGNRAIFRIGTASDPQNLQVVIYKDWGKQLVSWESSSAVFDESWHHVAVSDNGGSISVYIDGVEDGDSPATYTPSDSITLNNTTLGAIVQASSVSNYFSGRIDEVRVWNVVRTQAQIQANMCQKLSESENGLMAYYRLDASSGTTATDAARDNDGALHNMDNSDWVTSAIPLGDQSISDYTTPISLNLSHTDGDNMTIQSVGGNPDGVHLYRVDEAPNVTSPPPPLTVLSPQRYWGVYIVGGLNPSHTAVYDYGGHPGIETEDQLRLAERGNNASTSWTDLGVSPSGGTLTASGQTGIQAEYILGSVGTDNSLPVQLTSFEVNYINNEVVLEWVTQSEINNEGFEIWRSMDNASDFELIANYLEDPELIGAGNSTTTHVYEYKDTEVASGHIYYYQLWDISIDGNRQNHGIKVVDLTNMGNVPEKYTLYQNYPNPFNPVTQIKFAIPEEARISLEIYNMLGQKVRTIIKSEIFQSGVYDNIFWDSNDDFGHQVANGVYYLVFTVHDKNVQHVKKIVFMK